MQGKYHQQWQEAIKASQQIRSLFLWKLFTPADQHTAVFLFNLTGTASFNLVFLLYEDKSGPLLIIINLIAATMLYNVNK